MFTIAFLVSGRENLLLEVLGIGKGLALAFAVPIAVAGTIIIFYKKPSDSKDDTKRYLKYCIVTMLIIIMIKVVLTIFIKR